MLKTYTPPARPLLKVHTCLRPVSHWICDHCEGLGYLKRNAMICEKTIMSLSENEREREN